MGYIHSMGSQRVDMTEQLTYLYEIYIYVDSIHIYMYICVYICVYIYTIYLE